ncbi:MAG: hypothetical protein DDT26_02624 [Dehalococcoidia bacterium]|nr:hypothetical protein [Chloroflexota bacterium]
MNPIDWLEQTVLGFSELPSEDREAIFQFALLWSLFEAKALQTRASANSILALVHERAAQNRLAAGDFEPSLRYFRQRYFSAGIATQHYAGLHLRTNDNAVLVQQVLCGANNNPADSVAALLIVIYRLRNNLFHGLKWAYGIQNQRENFEHANAALMTAFTQLAQHDA